MAAPSKRRSVRSRSARAGVPATPSAATSPIDAPAPVDGTAPAALATERPAESSAPATERPVEPALAPKADHDQGIAAFVDGPLPASFGSADGDSPQSLPALLLAASRSAAPPPPPASAPDELDRPATRATANVVRGEIDDDPIDEAPHWADDGPDAAGADAPPAVDPVVAATLPVDPAEVPMAPPVPVIEPWADREPVAEVVAPAAEPSSYRISTPASSASPSRSKARLTPRLVPSLPADTESVTVGASPLFWEARPDRAAPTLPTLRRYVPPTPALPVHHHDFEGLVGDRLDAGEPDGSPEPAAHAPVHSGLLLAVADVDSGDEVLDRGDMGEGRIGQTLEGARVHGIEVIHAHRFGPAATAVDHLVISANGVWVVHAVDALLGPLERRDVGDWFRKDQRLFVDDAERTDLLDEARDRAAVIVDALDGSPFAALDVHPVLCFGTVQPGWVDEPFRLDGVSVTWRRHLVEPMLTPVLLDVETRSALTRWFATAAV